MEQDYRTNTELCALDPFVRMCVVCLSCEIKWDKVASDIVLPVYRGLSF